MCYPAYQTGSNLLEHFFCRTDNGICSTENHHSAPLFWRNIESPKSLLSLAVRIIFENAIMLFTILALIAFRYIVAFIYLFTRWQLLVEGNPTCRWETERNNRQYNFSTYLSYLFAKDLWLEEIRQAVISWYSNLENCPFRTNFSCLWWPISNRFKRSSSDRLFASTFDAN